MFTSCQEVPPAKVSGLASLTARGHSARPELEAEGEEAAWSLAARPHPEVALHSSAGILALSVPWTAWASVRPLPPSQHDVLNA